MLHELHVPNVLLMLYCYMYCTCYVFCMYRIFCMYCLCDIAVCDVFMLCTAFMLYSCMCGMCCMYCMYGMYCAYRMYRICTVCAVHAVFLHVLYVLCVLLLYVLYILCTVCTASTRESMCIQWPQVGVDRAPKFLWIICHSCHRSGYPRQAMSCCPIISIISITMMHVCLSILSSSVMPIHLLRFSGY